MNLTFLKSITVGMGFLIVGGLVVLGYGAMNQAGKLKLEKAAATAPEPPKLLGTLELKEPAGTEILEIATGEKRLYLRLGGGGRSERVLILDADSGTVLGTIIASEQAKAEAGASAPVEAAPAK